MKEKKIAGLCADQVSNSWGRHPAEISVFWQGSLKYQDIGFLKFEDNRLTFSGELTSFDLGSGDILSISNLSEKSASQGFAILLTGLPGLTNTEVRIQTVGPIDRLGSELETISNCLSRQSIGNGESIQPAPVILAKKMNPIDRILSGSLLIVPLVLYLIIMELQVEESLRSFMPLIAFTFAAANLLLIGFVVLLEWISRRQAVQSLEQAGISSDFFST